MGGCSSSVPPRSYDLVLLGTGGSGKSTLFNNVKSVENGSPNRFYSDTPEWSKITSYFHTVLKRAVTFMVGECQPHALYYDSIMGSDAMDVGFQSSMLEVYYQHGLKEYLQSQLDPQFLNVNSIMAGIQRYHKYITIREYLMFRGKTEKVREMQLTKNAASIRLIDVGGQISYRMKWISLFRDAFGCIYVSSLVPLHKMSSDNPLRSHIEESLNTFSFICYHPETPPNIFLFLNKIDMFGEYIKTYPLIDRSDVVTQLEYVKDMFIERCANPSRLHIIVTSALDRDNIQHAFDMTHQVILREHLKDLSLM